VVELPSEIVKGTGLGGARGLSIFFPTCPALADSPFESRFLARVSAL